MRLITKSGSATDRVVNGLPHGNCTVTLAESATRLSPSLEPRYYRDPAITELEEERIFGRSWQLVSHEAQLPNPGDYVTGRAGSQPVLVLRDEEGTLRAFRNVCRHRGSRLLTGSGQCGKAIRCLYHGWTYRTDGELIGVPEGRSIVGLDKSELGLFPARVETLCGLIFVNLDIHAQPLAEQVAGLPERLAPYGIERLQRYGEWHGTQPANWKIVIDNYNEGYHVPIAHPGLMRLLDYKHYDVEVHDGWVWFEAPLRDKPSGNPMERAYQRIVSPMPGLGEARPARLALRDDLPEHHDRPLSGPGRDLAHRRGWPVPRSRRGLRLPPPAREPAHAARAAGQQQGEHARGQGGLRPRARTCRRASRRAASSSGRSRTARRRSPGSRTGSARTWGDRAGRDRARRPRAHPRGRGGAHRPATASTRSGSRG